MYIAKIHDATRFNSMNEFLKVYPKPEWGTYHPQPSTEPSKFPCLVIEGHIEYNSNGADIQHITILYNFEEVVDVENVLNKEVARELMMEINHNITDEEVDKIYEQC